MYTGFYNKLICVSCYLWKERWSIFWWADKSQCPVDCNSYLDVGHQRRHASNNEVERGWRRCRQRHSWQFRYSSQDTVVWCADQRAAYRQGLSVHGVLSKLIRYSLRLADISSFRFTNYAIFVTYRHIYTVRHKKHTKIFYHNFYNTWPILTEIDMPCLG